jgi:hypothetical protein
MYLILQENCRVAFMHHWLSEATCVQRVREVRHTMDVRSITS